MAPILLIPITEVSLTLVGEKMRSTFLRIILLLGLSVASTSYAFMPAGGLWVIDSENNGNSGRGFQIEVENEIIVFTYFGYSSDGTGTFYLATGPIVNNTFTADLMEYRGGTALGGAYSPAAANGSPGRVSIAFSSGQHGIMTLPNEASRAISKFSFGYPHGPDGLLGTWMFTTILSSGLHDSISKTISVKSGVSTQYGNGLVQSANGDFVCEAGTVDPFIGTVLCFDYPSQTYSDTYWFKFSGDRGNGFGYYQTSSSGTHSSNNPLYVVRTKTKTGAMTGLNNGTQSSLSVRSSMASPSVAAIEPVKRDHERLFPLEHPGEFAADNSDLYNAVQRWAHEMRTTHSGDW